VFSPLLQWSDTRRAKLLFRDIQHSAPPNLAAEYNTTSLMGNARIVNRNEKRSDPHADEGLSKRRFEWAVRHGSDAVVEAQTFAGGDGIAGYAPTHDTGEVGWHWSCQDRNRAAAAQRIVFAWYGSEDRAYMEVFSLSVNEMDGSPCANR